MPINRLLGRTACRMRLARRISQARLAAALGVSQQQVAKYERGRHPMSGETLLAIAAVLDVPPAAIVGPAMALARRKRAPIAPPSFPRRGKRADAGSDDGRLLARLRQLPADDRAIVIALLDAFAAAAPAEDMGVVETSARCLAGIGG